MDWNCLIDEIQYYYIDNTTNMTADDVAENIRGHIRSLGYPCLEVDFDLDAAAKEWFLENHLDFDDYLENSVCDVEFLCKNDYSWYNGHDVDWKTFVVSFYGDWDTQIGVFSVSLV